MVRYNNERMQTLSPPKKRLSRPDGDHLPPFRITDRDIAIVRSVARFRFLRSDQIVRFLGASEQPILVRLKKLYWHAYLDRPEHQHSQLAAFLDEGNHPLVYGLGRAGARLLAELGDPIDDRLDWRTKNKRATNLFLAHTLEVADVVMAFDFACAKVGALPIIDHHALRPFLPEETRRLRDPFRLRLAVHPRELPKGLKHDEPITIGVLPDRLVSLPYRDSTRDNFAIEHDRGTMDVRSKQLVGKSSYRRKLLGYYHAWRRGLHTKVWGFQRFRVLTVTPSEERIGHMIDAQREITNNTAPGLFLYSTPERLAAHGAFGDAWVSSKGEWISILDRERR